MARKKDASRLGRRRRLWRIKPQSRVKQSARRYRRATSRRLERTVKEEEEGSPG